MPEGAAERLWVSVQVPAKVNLFLAVRGRRPDGYHDLVTVMQSVSLFDRLRAGVAGPPGRGEHPSGRRHMRVQLRVEAEGSLPTGGDNLALRAASALSRCLGGGEDVEVVDAPAGGPSAGASRAPRTILELRKGIPVAGGMAGGSADAAAALVALNQVWHCGLSRDELQSVGGELGSDVPFCVSGGTALAVGRGTELTRVLCRGTFHWVVCQAAEPLSTAAVYRAWDRLCRPGSAEPDAVLQALRAPDPEALGAVLHNELEPAAFSLRPELRGQRQALVDAGALGVVLSGSGPTLLALTSGHDAAAKLAAAVAPRFRRVVVAHSPAGGPELQER